MKRIKARIVTLAVMVSTFLLLNAGIALALKPPGLLLK